MREQDDLEEKLLQLAEYYGKYRREAYLFVLNALEHTVTALPEKRHVTGFELVHGITAYGSTQFGALGKIIFEQWGITQTLHFGEIVFHLIEVGLLSKTEHDCLDDFKDVFDLQQKMQNGISIAVDTSRISRFLKGVQQ